MPDFLAMMVRAPHAVDLLANLHGPPQCPFRGRGGSSSNPAERGQQDGKWRERMANSEFANGIWTSDEVVLPAMLT